MTWQLVLAKSVKFNTVLSPVVNVFTGDNGQIPGDVMAILAVYDSQARSSVSLTWLPFVTETFFALSLGSAPSSRSRGL